MIDIGDVRNSIEAMKRKELLEKYPHRIWEGKDGEWYTYLPRQGNGRVLKKRKSKSDLDLPKKCFSKKNVKDKKSVFTDGEVEKISAYIKENVSLINYGILLAFQTGMRGGELCTLKYSDIQGNKLHIRRTEIRYRGKDGKYVFEGKR